ncbi:MAG: AmmeMemoRadiSam system radical SAM enzyme [Lentisphaeria bacterium]|nr:AmmeMemoRadiSam system radical SAM enzyme [Lentisphaeria bacterium]
MTVNTRMPKLDTEYPARWSESESGGAVRCTLCPRNCRIQPGCAGYCAVRENRDGRLISLVYGKPAAIQNDPIEKKPLFHFLPGTRTFSIGTFGCNLGCLFCQNSSLSRGSARSAEELSFYPPDVLAEAALMHGCKSIAFTYNEPTVWAEYAVDIAKEAKKRGLAVLLVSNGYISRAAAEELYPLIDAANIDVKAFTEDFYRTMCAGSLKPVMDACVFFKKELKRHLELTQLIIPGKNDAEEDINRFLDWTADALGLDTPLHFTAYFPAWRYHESPPTPPALIRKICERAVRRGFRFVHPGNI